MRGSTKSRIGFKTYSKGRWG